MRSVLLTSWLAAALLCGCGKKRSAVDDLADDAKNVVLPDIRAKIAAGHPEDAIPCSRVTANVDTLEREGYAELAKDIHQVCDHDLQIAYIRRETETAEAARKASPDDKALRECFSGKLSTAIERLARARRVDDEARALIARFNAVCPEMPVKDTDLVP